jgi:hypothetical protein
MLLFFAKYEGAESTTWAWVVALYGAFRAEGSSSEKREPVRRIVGYIVRRIFSNVEGIKGDDLDVFPELCEVDFRYGELSFALGDGVDVSGVIF